MKRICSYCQLEFTAERKDKHYCSSSCRQQSYMQRKIMTLTENLMSTKNDTQSDDALNTAFQNVKTSHDVLKEQSENVNTSIDTLKEKEYTPLMSKFINDLNEEYNQRDNEYKLHCLIKENKTAVKSIEWISIRCRCLVESILRVSERKNISLDDLKEITNAFTLIMRSPHYKQLPEDYPYTETIKELRDKLKTLCLEHDGVTIELTLKREFKIRLIVIRCELRTIVPKIKFSNLTFSS